MQYSAGNTERVLTLAELEAYDPDAPPGKSTARGIQRAFFCPFCGDGSDRRKWWRCLWVNLDSGAWICKRPACGAKGTLREKWTHLPPRQRARAALQRTTALPELREEPDAEKLAKLHERLKREKPIPLAGTPGAEYLAGRGIPLEIAEQADVKYAPRWFDRPAVLFPMRGDNGELLAYNGRHTDGLPPSHGTPKTHSYGPRGQAVFAWPGALDADPVVLVEGPMCVLTLALMGIPAIAPMATSLPRWVMRRLAFRDVVIAFDNDLETHAGQQAAVKLEAELIGFGCAVHVLRPSPEKDFNDIYTRHGMDALRESVAPVLALIAEKQHPTEAQQEEAPMLRCPVCLSAGHTTPSEWCDVSTVHTCKAYLPAGSVSPLPAPAGVEYEPGADW